MVGFFLVVEGEAAMARVTRGIVLAGVSTRDGQRYRGHGAKAVSAHVQTG